MAFDAFKHAVHNRLKGAYEVVVPHQTESNFKTTGVRLAFSPSLVRSCGNHPGANLLTKSAEIDAQRV